MLLTGCFERSVDEKLRIAIPKRIRDALKQADPQVLFVAPGLDGSLCIYTQETFAALAEQFKQKSPTQQDVRAFSRLFFSQAESVEIDSQGRIRIPDTLANLASLEKDAVLLGVQDHMELWSKARWEAYRAEKAPHFDEIAESAFNPS